MDENKVITEEVMSENNNEKRCSKCGALIAEGQQFCPNCGKKVGGEKDKRRIGKGYIITAILLVVLIAAGAFGGIKINEKIKYAKFLEEVKKNPNTPHDHEWEEATCTEPARCKLCGKTKGAAFGHKVDKWETVKEAACQDEGIQEGSCIRCGEIQQKSIAKLGHRWGAWNTVAEPTCDVNGRKERTCTVCGAVDKQSITCLGHAWVEGDIVIEARYDSKGSKVYTCSRCGKVEEHEYEASPEEYERTYKEDCKTYTYKEIARDPDSYKYEMAKFKGEVIQVLEDGNYVALRVNITKTSWGYTDTIYVMYERKPGEPRILEDDIITIWGFLDGLYTYESVLGAEITLPWFIAEYLTVN